MATLSEEKRRKRKRKKWFFGIFLLFIGLLFFPWLAAYLDGLLQNGFEVEKVNITYFESIISIAENTKQQMLFLLLKDL